MYELLATIPAIAYWWGACACLASIVILREYVWRKRVQSREELLHRQQAELTELKAEQVTQQFQIDWTATLLTVPTSSEQLCGLLAQRLPHAARPCLWVLERGPEGTAAQISIGAGPVDSIQRQTVAPELWDQLEIQSRLEWTGSDLRERRWIRLPAELARRIDRLIVVRCGDHVPVDRLLCTTHIPEWTPNESENLRLLMWACRLWRRNLGLPTPATPAVSEDESRMVRIMLELRTIADMEFGSPMEMLREFLRILGKATGYERVSLYLTTHEGAETPVERFCWAGIDSESDRLDAWYKFEDRLVSEHLSAPELVLLTPDRLTHGTQRGPVTSAAIAPLTPGEDPIGLLCLSSRSPVRPGPTEQQIIVWAARFLMQTLARTVDRVVVEEQARRDFLTKLANRQTFDQELQRQLQQVTKTQETCSLILLDLDRFKQINDTYGHPAGDAVLREVSRRIEMTVEQTRSTDRPLVARLGGEELAVLLPGVGHAGALRIAESIRQAVRQDPIPHDGLEIQVTASLGVAVSPRNGRTANELISAADVALYAAKANGRDCVHSAPPQSAAPALEPVAT